MANWESRCLIAITGTSFASLYSAAFVFFQFACDFGFQAESIAHLPGTLAATACQVGLLIYASYERVFIFVARVFFNLFFALFLLRFFLFWAATLLIKFFCSHFYCALFLTFYLICMFVCAKRMLGVCVRILVFTCVPRLLDYTIFATLDQILFVLLYDHACDELVCCVVVVKQVLNLLIWV